MTDTAPASPTDDALAALGRLVAAKAAPARMVQEVGTLVAGWATEPEMGPAEAAARVEHLWDSLSKDAADLQEQIADAGDGNAQATADARRMLAAMNAAVAALAAALERL